MKITDVLVAEHVAFGRLFDHMERALTGCGTVAEVRMLAGLVEGLLQHHGATEEHLVYSVLDHVLEERGELDRLHQDHREIDMQLQQMAADKDLPAACRLVERYPGQRFVLDHIGKPPIRDGALEPWAADIRKLAMYSNVFCKVSGMVTETDWKRWKAADLGPYLDVVFEAFGTGRLMIGSDWPVCTVAAPYDRVMAIVTDYLARFPHEEQGMVLEGNARRIYRLCP